VSLKTKFVIALAALFLLLACTGGAAKLKRASWRNITETGRAVEAIGSWDNQPFAIESGEFFASPARVELRCMTPVYDRPGFYDRHVGNGECPVLVVVVMQDSRALAGGQ
jgi:hypothetical protein